MSFVRDLFSSPKAPAVPDPAQLIGAQSTANVDTARVSAKLNRPDTYTPFGSVTYEDLGDDRWRAEQTFSPEMQGLYDRQIDVGTGVSDAAKRAVNQLPTNKFSLSGIPQFQSEIDYSGLTDIPSQGNLDNYAKSGADAYMSEWSRINDPFYADQLRDLETKLANQGISRGSEAYTRAMGDYNRSLDSARTGATSAAVQQGSALRSALLADALMGRQQGISERTMDVDLANRGRAQAVSDRLLERSQPMNELAALIQGAPAVQTPQPIAGGGQGVQPPDVTGAYGLSQSAAQNQYLAQLANRNAAWGGLSGVAGAYLGGR